MQTQELRNLFPILNTKVYGRNLVYFDNAATSQRPQSVIDLMTSLALNSNANIHRAVHFLANEATEMYESTRDAVKDFIGASSREEIVFTSGTTASINLVAYSFGEAFINEGDEVIVSEAEHHSDIVPWQIVCQRKKAVLKVIPVDDHGILQTDMLEDLINERTRIVAVTHISNVLGLVNPIEDIVKISHSHGVPVLVDGAQGIVHQKVNVQKSDVDFYAFSGHKLYSATGTGVLYGKKKWLDAMPPFMGGGEMIDTVKFSGTTYAPVPEKFEAGTQNFNAVPTLREGIRMTELMRESEWESSALESFEMMYDFLSKDERIRLYGVPYGTSVKVPVFSFTVSGVHHEDLALILDKMGIAVRSGQMCAEPLMDRFGVTGMLRVSLAPYNTAAEVEYFKKSLNKAIDMLA
ncbi:MAG: aminotransferase class V-fold PLP-dependent enzyme [Candidatus Cryptobacteroides sp.]